MKFAILFLLLVASQVWADSISGEVTAHGESVKPADVVMAYQRRDRSLMIKIFRRVLSADERKWTASKNNNLREMLGELDITVFEKNGRLTFRDNGWFIYYVPKDKRVKDIFHKLNRDTVKLDGTLKGTVRVQSAGEDPGARWNLQFDGQLLDPDLRAPKYYPPIQVGPDRIVAITAEWREDGSPIVVFTAGPPKHNNGQGMRGPALIRQLISAVEQRANFSHNGFTISNDSGVYTVHTAGGLLGSKPNEVVLDEAARRLVLENLREAARYVDVK